MKQRFFLLIVCLGGFLISTNAQQKYFIDGTVYPTPKDLTVHLYYQYPGKGAKHDTARVINGKFSFEGNLPQIVLGFLVILPDGQKLNDYTAEHMSLPPDQIGIYLENGNISVKVDDKHPQDVLVSGTPNNEAIQQARPLLRKYKAAEAELKKKLDEAGKDSAKNSTVINAYTQMVKERTTEVGKYIETHPSSLASLDLLKRWVMPTDDLAAAKKFYGFLSNSLQQLPGAMMYKQFLDAAANVDINSMAPDFSIKDTSGVMHSLKDYRGKYVLIDFWASWCGPCLREMPNVVRAYNKFKNKNFEILGVSLDGGASDARDKWTAAIRQQGMKWPQLSELEGWNSSVNGLYMVSSVPMNFLLDPNGKIIAKNLRGEDLSNTLEKFL